MNQLKAVVFDLDGLMVDSEPLARRAWELVLKDYGRVLDDDLHKKMVGLRIEDSSRLLSQTLQIEVDPADLARKEQTRFELIMEDGLPVMPGLYQLVGLLAESKIPWAVATSSRLSYAHHVLESIDLLDQCWAVASGEEVPRGKPYPDVFLLASERLGVKPEHCLAFEDSVHGCQAAKAAGMATAAVPADFNTRADFSCADYLYRSLEDVVEDFDSLIWV